LQDIPRLAGTAASSSTAATAVPVIDIRRLGTVGHARAARGRAQALRDDCLAWFPRPVKAAIPLLDRFTRDWLRRSASPYVEEVEAIAAALGFSGIWLLNGSYQWGCTTRAFDQDDAPWLLRTLDWPFAGLGRHVEIARMAGDAGDFVSITWPGYVGVLTGMAPGRFAAAMNQGPLWRRTRHPWLRMIDIGANAVRTTKVRHMPPDQLLRTAFEQCRDFAAARNRLETVPIARPAIFTLTGCAAGECCVIERTEEGGVSRSIDTAAANDWCARRDGWEARVGGTRFFTCSIEDAAENSRDRRDALMQWPGRAGCGDFSWVSPPVLNPFTRLAVEACAASGVLRVIGYERVTRGELPQAVTMVGEIVP
jgi:hypothetical protein